MEVHGTLSAIKGEAMAATTSEQQVQIVLIDDDEVDVEAVARLLRKHRLPYDLVTFNNGSDAKNALAGSFGQELAKQPYLILLDLNMPRMNGIELLDWLRAAATSMPLDRFRLHDLGSPAGLQSRLRSAGGRLSG